ncbi:putative glyoxalase superfamily protein PhnB [Chitinophaga skermanii]|uniref:Putative glyoxalase superfamily protein PhnB n=1 Tax=Chitinophaga skermanii TaxID=331697 RepID=A0A327Q786_9BACT|nr:VOC family protein [Chitinophaga skermanii]RAI97696.1 putative glyoxalase superfamily protein PhnB [Chitinophaga skermanii]
MQLVSIRIITADIQRLTEFYARITGGSFTFYTSEFAELKTGTATLAIGSTKTLQAFGGAQVAQAAANKTAIIEFKVDHVDNDYERLAEYIQPYIVQPPTTMPWGNRSLLFRDPDGNLVNFFTPVAPGAIQKFAD